ncbi:MAG: hypothetical protein M3O93_07585 [Chloroflexota bacterium]|nr:hypothetical protein [Chloroflexota bacterium]
MTRRTLHWLAATALALVLGFVAAFIATRILRAILEPLLPGSPAGATLLVVGYLTWVAVAVVVSALWLRRMRNR